jgi:ABC-2 type transport system ATP-binding protein
MASTSVTEREPAQSIVADGLTKRYGAITAVDDLTFTVRSGAVTGFLGPNGAGKTTTLRMVLGLARPTAGSATILGQPFGELPDPARSVGANLEICGMHPGRSGRNHLRALAAFAGLPSSRVDEVLDIVEMREAADRRAGGYSTGMRQRLGLAATLLGDPEVLVLDEPANGLDPQGIRWLRDFLRAAASEGRTVLVSSHVLSEVQQTVDDVIVIHRGKLVKSGPIASLVTADAVRARSPRAADLAAALQRDGADVRADGNVLIVTNRSTEQVGELAFAGGLPLHELALEVASLEEVFFRLTSDQAESPG